MRGNEKVIEQLNVALSSELTAIAQYMVQSELCHNWGYHRLGELTKKRAIEEMKHAEKLIERIVFFDSVPKIDVTLKPRVGGTVQEQLEIDAQDEREAIVEYNNAAVVCTQANDAGTRELFEDLIKDEEHHTDFLEAQMQAVKDMGIANYLSEQMKDGED